MAAERKICHLSAGIDSFTDASSDLSCLNIDEFSILKDKYGRPTIPSGFLGSISHKGNVGVAGNVEAEFWGYAGRSPDNPANEPFIKWLSGVSNTSDADVPKLFSTSYVAQFLGILRNSCAIL